MIKIDKIQLNNFKFFIDDEKNNTFEPNKNGMLIYGENGSGKSSLFKAFDFLATPSISEIEFNKNVNIFKDNNTFLEFDFSNNELLRIDSDHLDLEDNFPYISKLSVTKPIIDYKSLLLLSFEESKQISKGMQFDPVTGFLLLKDEKKNLYSFFEKLLENYPINENQKLLKELEDDEYFEAFKNIILNDLFDDMNIFLSKFNQNFNINKISLSGVGKKVYLEIDYFDKTIENHHNFLNEARLSALAISVYFAIIKKQFSLIENDSLKILVLDDLLISLDMNNRLSLINILKSEFSEFQIFFFTHEKALFDLVNEKMNLKPYEIYVTKQDEYEVPFIKQSNTLLDQAIYQKDTHNYGCSANILRQYIEKILCNFLPKEQVIGNNCKKISLENMLNKAIKFESTNDNTNQDIVDIFNELKTFKKILLNDASHYNNTDIYKAELESTIAKLKKLEELNNSFE
jgi:ABC-type lipoprotein export system ATPase subunit